MIEKDQYSEIKKHLLQGDFEETLASCAEFVEEFPNNYSGWACYICAYCEVKNMQELVNSSYVLEELPIYEEALGALDQVNSEKLVTLNKNIENERKKRLAARNKAQEKKSCFTYFDECIRELDADIKGTEEKRNQCIEDDKAELKKIKKVSSTFFFNNFIYFFVYFSIIITVFVFLYNLMQVEVSTLFELLPLIVAAVIIGLVFGLKHKKRSANRNQLILSMEFCEGNQKEIFALQTEIERKKAAYNILKKKENKAIRAGKKGDVASVKKLLKEFNEVYKKINLNNGEE